MFIRHIKKWIKKYEKYFFSYKDGYFVLPYLNDSPELLISSFVSMPFVSHNADEKVATSKNPFTNAELRYEEVEKGLWMIITDVEFKANIQTKSIYENKKNDYYYLVLAIYENELSPLLDMEINNVYIPSKSWTLYRPGVQIDGFHKKGTKGIIFDFCFSKEWLENNLFDNQNLPKNSIQEIFSSKTDFLTWQGIVPEAEIYVKNIWNCLSKQAGYNCSKLQLKVYTLEVLNIFFGKINQKYNANYSTSQSLTDIEALKKVESYLIQNLKNEFPGLVFLGNMVNMSPSKLKSIFKVAYGKTIFQYFKEKQMELAFQMLKNTDAQIKNISTTFGYENPSKFAQSFKKHHHILPSELKNIHSLR